MQAPPSEIRLVDTGERRFPESGEYYLWWDTWQHKWMGPHIIEDVVDDWVGPENQFAIYKTVEMPEVYVEIGVAKAGSV